MSHAGLEGLEDILKSFLPRNSNECVIEIGWLPVQTLEVF